MSAAQGSIESRICAKIDSVVLSLNHTLKEGLGEVSAKCAVDFAEIVNMYNRCIHGKRPHPTSQQQLQHP